MGGFLEHPADLSHALPRPTLRGHAGHDSHRQYGGGGVGNADRGVGSERCERRAALDDARRCLTAQRRGGACHRESLRRPAEARPAGAGHSRPWRRHLSQWRERGGDELVPVRRSGGRNRRPRDTAVASLVPGTLPDAGGAQMRTLKIIEHISLDGVIQHSADDGDFPYSDWTAPYRTPAGRDAVLAAQGERFDLLLGRRTYDIWSGFWPKAPSSPMADGLNAATKYVATHRPESLEWGPFEGLGPDIVEGIRRIKSQDGPDLILSGSSTLTSTLLEHGLADEVLLVVYPVLLGTGKRFFAEGTPPRSFELVSTKAMPSGIILSTYKVAGPLKTG